VLSVHAYEVLDDGIPVTSVLDKTVDSVAATGGDTTANWRSFKLCESSVSRVSKSCPVWRRVFAALRMLRIIRSDRIACMTRWRPVVPVFSSGAAALSTTMFMIEAPRRYA